MTAPVFRPRAGWATPLAEGGTVAWLGGSITQAGGAADAMCFRAKAMHGLRESIGVLREVNAAVNGTGSEFAAFRVARDVLAHDPDVVVVEFCVNDASTWEPEVVLSSLASLLRQCAGHNVVVTYALAQEHLVDIAAGRTPRIIALHEQVCDDHGIPSVWMGLALAHALLRQECCWDDVFADAVHPLAAAHAQYARALLPALLELNSSPGSGPELPPVRLAGMTGANMTRLPSDLPPGWRREDGDLVAEPGAAALTVPFEGVTVGVLSTVGRDSGDLDVRVDDGQWLRQRLYDDYSHLGRRPIPRVVARGLPRGSHVLQLRPAASKDDRSVGYTTRLSCLLSATS